MPSEFSSGGSISDAQELAENLGIRFDLLAIHDVFTAYQRTLEPLFSGTPFGLAEENLQPRIRGALLMALSNKFGALVLTTGNKSEMSTGYCTLYGDMVGALAVLGDAGVCAGGVCQPGARGDPGEHDCQAALGGAEAGAARYGLAASV
jgi:NAD+ synthase (glutamine-hydrolysing)